MLQSISKLNQTLFVIICLLLIAKVLKSIYVVFYLSPSSHEMCEREVEMWTCISTFYENPTQTILLLYYITIFLYLTVVTMNFRVIKTILTALCGFTQ